jgi:hypothetical protein
MLVNRPSFSQVITKRRRPQVAIDKIHVYYVHISVFV